MTCLSSFLSRCLVSNFSGLASGVRRPASSSRSGIALVIVLGVLSVMLIMAVAFAVAMRTERLAAANHADSVRARQLVQTGIARALDDLAGKLGTNGLESGGLSYPPWDVTNSYEINPLYTSTKRLYVLTGTATNFVPRALWSAAEQADNQDAMNHWLQIKNTIYDTNGIPTEDTLMGCVKYLILNCSGLLDANFAGGAERGLGTNPMEIAINYLPEMSSYDDFAENRTNNCRYETLEELAALNTNAFDGAPSNFTVYSRALPGYWATNPAPGIISTQVNLAGGRDELGAPSRSDLIFEALSKIGINDPERGNIYRNLLDYVDSNSVPETSSVEPVPMINEIVVSNHVNVTAGTDGTRNYFIETGVFVETWYPFVTNAVESFKLDSTVTFAEAGGIKPGDLGASDIEIGTPSARSFAVISRLSSETFIDYANVDPIRLITTITLSVKLSDDTVVDQLPALVFTNEINCPGFGDYYTNSSLECLDPRFNYYITNTNLWRRTSYGSLSATNACTINYLNNPDPNYTGDKSSEMFVANRPLHSVAELGYLVYSTNHPWHTIKLYGPDLHRVLDVFAIDNNSTNDYVVVTNRGLVNPNSRQDDALAAVFADMPVDQYPGGPSTNLTMPSARAFAANISAGGPFTNLSDVGRHLGEGSFPVGASELEKEAYFRYAAGLLNLRQNLFTIIIEAQVASGGNIPHNPVRQRAVALVWRDPYSGEMFVRSIKWLRD